MKSLAIGIAIGLMITAAIQRIRPPRKPAAWIAAMEPSERSKIPSALAVAVTAGIVEELYFRLALPLAFATTFADAWFGHATALLMFAGLHRYQGWIGAIAAALIGALLLLIYLGSGSLLTSIAVHISIDAATLILRPLVTGRIRLSSSTGIRS